MSGGSDKKKLILVGLSLSLVLMAMGCGGELDTAVPSMEAVRICINVGEYETPYNVRYYGLEISCQGGVTDYTHVDFEEMTNAMLDLISVDFQQVEPSACICICNGGWM